MKVWKYELWPRDVNEITMPAGARPLHVDVQAGKPCLWVLVDPGAPLETRRFRLAGTGHEIEGEVRHVGTCLQLDGVLVWHVFEVTS